MSKMIDSDCRISKDGGNYIMKRTEFDKLPKEAQERIRVRNECSDMLADPRVNLEKADLLLEYIESEYMMYLPSDEVLNKWKDNYSRIGMMVSIIRDYMIKAKEELASAETWVGDGNKVDGWGGE